MKKNFVFFIDDNIRFLENLTNNKPNSIFDDNYLCMLKRLHDKHNLKIQLNLFYENETFNLSMMTDKYKQEFIQNSDWLNFGFHSKNEFPDYPYIDADYDEVYSDYTDFEREVTRFAGSQIISKSLVTHWLVLTKEGVMALKDKGVRMLSSSAGNIYDYPEIRCSFSSSHNQRLEDNKAKNVSRAKICRRDSNGISSMPCLCNYNHVSDSSYYGKIKMYYDEETDMYFNRSDSITLNAVRMCDIEPALKKLLESEMVHLLIHEQYFYSDYYAYEKDFEEKLDFSVGYMLKNGFTNKLLNELINMQK